ncbi:MAG: hypothetical protein HC777_02675 [Hyphomonadaceae bacterium]|nr:hypothetical protein [Hyphomonadaceae bacterium]
MAMRAWATLWLVRLGAAPDQSPLDEADRVAQRVRERPVLAGAGEDVAGLTLGQGVEQVLSPHRDAVLIGKGHAHFDIEARLRANSFEKGFG